MFEPLSEHYIFRVGYEVIWESPHGPRHGVIQEICRTPYGVRFWVSCAPHWVAPEEVHFKDRTLSPSLP